MTQPRVMTRYYARPNNDADCSDWWGAGGCELWDELDPLCCTERGVFHEVGPMTAIEAGAFDARARLIVGYHSDLDCAVVFRAERYRIISIGAGNGA